MSEYIFDAKKSEARSYLNDSEGTLILSIVLLSLSVVMIIIPGPTTIIGEILIIVAIDNGFLLGNFFQQ